MFKFSTSKFVAGAVLLSVSPFVSAGFLDMPDTQEVPEYERGSLLHDMDIPPVRDRDPDPRAGHRLNVKEFRLQGVVEYPELGITRQELAEKVEELRFDLMQEGELTDSGYTMDELGQISDLVANIENKASDGSVSAVDVQKLVFLIREQRRQRGITLGMIETVADTITQYYRERGFILAKAYIPQQKVRDGVVTLTLLLGELGYVDVTNAYRAPEAQIRNIFNNSLYKPVTAWNIEESLYLVNDLPGISAQGFFQPGTQVGDTGLNVNVVSERKYTTSLRVDNHGSEATGMVRPYAEFAWHNPGGYGDEFKIRAYHTVAPANTLYGALSYSFPLFSPRLRGDVSVSSNDFVFSPTNEEDQAGDALAGKAFVMDFGLGYKLKRSRTETYGISTGLAVIDTELLVGASNDTGQSIMATNFDVAFNFDILKERTRSLHVGSVALVGSSWERENDTEGAKSSFILKGDYSRLSFFRLPFTRNESRLVLKASAQIAGQEVGSVNQMSLSGPTKSRGYQVGTGFFDDALYFGADWYLPMFADSRGSLWGTDISQALQPYLFTDLALGQFYDTADASDVTSGTFFDVGAGLSMNFGSARANLMLAVPLVTNIGLEDEDVPSASAYFDLQYSF